jgi:hypothetical protein
MQSHSIHIEDDIMQSHSIHIEDDIMQNHEEKKKVKKVKNQGSMGKTNFFFNTLPFSPRAVLATWMHVGAPQKYRKNELKTHFEQNPTTGSYGVGIGRAWCC